MVNKTATFTISARRKKTQILRSLLSTLNSLCTCQAMLATEDALPWQRKSFGDALFGFLQQVALSHDEHVYLTWDVFSYKNDLISQNGLFFKWVLHWGINYSLSDIILNKLMFVLYNLPMFQLNLVMELFMIPCDWIWLFVLTINQFSYCIGLPLIIKKFLQYLWHWVASVAGLNILACK